ncbi:SseB family protein [Bacillus cereus]|nr:SseB family protein [Bacillus cereus]
MEQISVKKLEEVLVVAGDDKQKQKEFYELLLSTEFYVAGSLEAEDGATEGILRLRHFQGEGRWIVPFFTQMEFVKDVLPEGTPLITIRGKELIGSIEKDATAVLNVGTDISKTFIPEEIADIASGRIFNYYK